MPEDKKRYINRIYENIIEEISISETMLIKAISSYSAVGKWLGDCDPDLDVKIMPQGSMNLGTVIKPISDEDDYDIDLVCLLKNGSELRAAEIKGIVGKRLKEHKTYKGMLESEGKRCWTLRYDEFHMDILPCVPKDTYYIEPGRTELRLTHKNDDGTYEDKYSNPAKYKLWFEERMQSILLESKRSLAIENKVEIDDVPTYSVRTPLQKAIQLLKRHRDITFADDNTGIAPISIIITTLAAKAYKNENNVFDALNGILSGMAKFIEKDAQGNYKISNPVMEEENFADKWAEEPEKAKAFFGWLSKAREDIVTKPMLLKGTVEQSKLFKSCFGENVTKRAYSKIGDETRVARENQNLYTSNLKGGVSTVADNKSKPIPRHTFYGE